MTAKKALAIIEYYSTLNEIGQDEKQLDFDNALRFIKQTLAELETIKSAESGEAIKILQKLATIPLNIDDNHWTTLSTQDDYKSLENYILKAQAQEKELKELKSKVKELLNTNIMTHSGRLVGKSRYAELLNELKQMVGESDE